MGKKATNYRSSSKGMMRNWLFVRLLKKHFIVFLMSTSLYHYRKFPWLLVFIAKKRLVNLSIMNHSVYKLKKKSPFLGENHPQISKYFWRIKKSNWDIFTIFNLRADLPTFCVEIPAFCCTTKMICLCLFNFRRC